MGKLMVRTTDVFGDVKSKPLEWPALGAAYSGLRNRLVGPQGETEEVILRKPLSSCSQTLFQARWFARKMWTGRLDTGRTLTGRRRAC